MMPGEFDTSRSSCISKETSKDKKMDVQQERSVGGTSSLNGYQKSSCPRRDGEKNIICVHY